MIGRRKPLAVGESWFVKMPNSVGLCAVTIDEITPLTVVLRLEKDGIVGYEGHLGRFVRREIKFVERVAR